MGTKKRKGTLIPDEVLQRGEDLYRLYDKIVEFGTSRDNTTDGEELACLRNSLLCVRADLTTLACTRKEPFREFMHRLDPPFYPAAYMAQAKSILAAAQNLEDKKRDVFNYIRNVCRKEGLIALPFEIERFQTQLEQAELLSGKKRSTGEDLLLAYCLVNLRSFLRRDKTGYSVIASYRRRRETTYRPYRSSPATGEQLAM